MRQIVLDTETTGIEISAGNRIIEIGCVELVDRKLTGNHYHQYINPGRESEDGALAVHGITTEYLRDKPIFADVWDAFFSFIEGAELIIHNAPFDVGFINEELRICKAKQRKITDYCSILDSLSLAKHKHPGQKNNLDALCKRYGVDNSQRELHGALLDAEILADVYLMLTGGQVSLLLGGGDGMGGEFNVIKRVAQDRGKIRVIKADATALIEHEKKLDSIASAAGKVVWREGV